MNDIKANEPDQLDAVFARLAERIDERLRTDCTDWDGLLNDDQFTLPVIAAELNTSGLREVVEAALKAARPSFFSISRDAEQDYYERREALSGTLAALFGESK